MLQRMYCVNTQDGKVYNLFAISERDAIRRVAQMRKEEGLTEEDDTHSETNQ